MEREYDLINELGPRNWLDAAAGEAVILGYRMKRPDLERAGTELGRLIHGVRFDSDDFARVIAGAKDLEKLIAQVKEEVTRTIYIDKVCMGNSLGEKDPGAWEFDFVLLGSRYRIQMNLFEYRESEALLDERKKQAENVVCSFFGDPSFESYAKNVVYTDREEGKYEETSFHDDKGLVRTIIWHDHVDGDTRGWQDTFFFDDYETAVNAWRKIRPIISDQRR